MFLTRPLHSESPPAHANSMHGAKGGDLNMWRRFRRTSCIVQARICGAKSTQVWWVSMPQHVMHARRAYAQYRTRYTYPLLLTPVLPPIGLSTRAYRNFQLISGFSLELKQITTWFHTRGAPIHGQTSSRRSRPKLPCIFHPASYVSALGILPRIVP